MAGTNRSRSIAPLLLVLAVVLCCATATAGSQGPAGTAAPADAGKAVAARYSSAGSGADSALRAGRADDLKERARLGWAYGIRHSRLGDWYARGGVFMHPLLLCFVVGVVFIVERAYTLNRARVDARLLMDRIVKALQAEGVEAALRVCENTRGPIASVLHAGLLRASAGPEAVRGAAETAGVIEISFLERGLVFISTASRIAPLLGFLAAVRGVMNTLAAAEAAEQLSANAIVSGVGEALIPAVAGLCIAILCTLGHSYCAAMIDRSALEMEEASAILVNELAQTGTM